ncbi:MAG: ABC transporter ATP-binding protein [Candidatus Caccosoma sp.]|nr:ABC transporter ATP-binding protein [Candidatus Caccosoma sp.]
MENIIQVKNLDKSFKDVHAVNDLSFAVKKGELFAFLGVNGAGKSTTISIMCGMLKKDKGSIIIDNKDIEKDYKNIIKDIGVVFQNSLLDGVLSVKDNLMCRASLYGIYGNKAKERINELATLLDFKKLLNRTVNKLSGGQRRKIDVARALLNDPKILILDEPTTGLDPQTRKTMWEVIESYRKNKQMTVFLTTHYMEETTDADYVVILDSGKIVAQGTPLELKNKYTGDFITLYNANIEDVKKLNLPYEVVKDGIIRIEIKNTEAAKNLIINNPTLFKDFEIIKGKMDDVFLAATGKKLVGGN